MAIFTVTTLIDENNGTGNLSLREAILAANAAAGADTIVFATGGTILLTLGELTITDSLTIDGDLNNNGTPDITVNAQNNSRVFSIDDGNGAADKTVTLDGLIITGGRTTGDVQEGGGIRSREILTVTNSTISGNSTAGNASGGGGIFNNGSLTVSNSTISGNSTTGTYIQGIGTSGGGGILSVGSLTVSNSTVSGNATAGRGSNGGGVFSVGSLTMSNSTVSGNATTGTFFSNGGGIYFGNGSATISNSTVSGNSTTGSSSDGGGIYNRSGSLTVSNSTISGNRVNADGGGIFNRFGLLQLRNSTVTLNTAPTGQGSGVGIESNGLSSVQVVSSIIAGNVNTDVDFVGGGTNSFVSQGSNLIGDGNATGNFTAPGDQLIGNGSPGLAPLANNGGPTQTHALLAGSLAINAGSNPDGLTTDQRGTGFARVAGGRLDIGAFEFVAPPIVSITASPTTVQEGGTAGTFTIARSGAMTGALTVTLSLGFGLDLNASDFTLTGASISGSGTTRTIVIPAGAASVALTFTALDDLPAEALETLTLTVVDTAAYDVSPSQSTANIGIAANDTFVTNTGDFNAPGQSSEGTLRQAILNANAFAGAQTVTFANALSGGTVTLTGGQLTITDDVTVDGDLNNNGTPDITVNGNNASRVLNIDDGTSTARTVTLDGLTITGGRTTGPSQVGGGIRNRETLTLSNSTISGNSTTGSGSSGGGLYSFGSLTVSNSTISNNSATGTNGSGGGIYSYGRLTVSNSTLSGNASSSEGGGLFSSSELTGQTATITNSTISGNSTASYGGGIFNLFGRLQLRNSTVTANTAPGSRGSGVASLGGNYTRTEVVSSIIAGNANTDVDVVAGTNSFVSQGTNLIGDGNATTAFTATGDQIIGNASPGLAALANNGGATQTHALLASSAAINAGSNPQGLTTDQRGTGFARVVGGTADIGAFESAFLPTPIVSITASPATVQEGGAAGTFTIARAGATTGALTVTLSLGFGLDLNASDFTLTGGSISISGTTATIVIPTGAASVALTFTAIDDLPAEALETLTLTVVDTAAYDVSPSQGAANIGIAANDTFVTNTGDFSASGQSTEGTLRQAILNANAFAGAQTVTFANSLSGGTVTLTGGELTITDDVTVDGDLNNNGSPDITVNGNNASRVFNVDDGTSIAKTVTLDGLTITGGRTTGNIQRGGGIFLAGESLTITNSILSGNTAVGDVASGGGIYNSFGSLTVNNSTIAGNTTTGDGGAIGSNGSLVIVNSTLSGNTATGSSSDGGGIFSNANLTGQIATVINSTISGNSATVRGGGIFNFDGLLQLRNSTVTDNSAAANQGSGIASFGDTATRTEVVSSIVAGNASTDIDVVSGINNTFASQGNNLIGDGNATGAFTAAGDITGNADPGLAPLANNGGNTQTHALLANSPALNAGSNPNGLTTDQRGIGFARVSGGATDIGAFEVQFNTINGTGGRDTLVGGATNDIITGFAGADTITTGAGLDRIVYTNLRDAGDVIKDFAVGFDQLVLTQLLDSLVAGGYGGTNAITDGYVRFAASGSNTLVQIDPDGLGTAATARNFLTLEGVAVAAANNPNNFVF